MPYFDKSGIVAYQGCILSYYITATPIGQNPMIVYRMWNQWVQECHKEHHAWF